MDWLRRMEFLVRTPFIMITGGDPADYKDMARKAGAVGIFGKPLDIPKLLEILAATMA